MLIGVSSSGQASFDIYTLRFFAFVILTAVFAPPPAAAQDHQPKRIEKCSLVVAGTPYIDGPCDFTILDSDGSFQIMAPDNTYFAQVQVDRPGHAIGYWNEEKGANHAHSPLGELTRNEACWSNESATVCAW